MAFLNDAFFLRISVFIHIEGHGQRGGIMISPEE